MPESSPADTAWQVAESASEALVRAVAGEAMTRALGPVLDLALAAFPSAEHASVTLVRSGDAVTAAASGPAAQLFDTRQYLTREGPCLTAIATGSIVVMHDADDARWPQLARRARGQTSISSALSAPILTGPRIAGSVNIMSARRAAFDAQDAAFAPLAAAVAAAVLLVAAEQERVARVRQQAEEFRSALAAPLRSALTVLATAASVLRSKRSALDEPGRQALDLLGDELEWHHELSLALLDYPDTHPPAR